MTHSQVTFSNQLLRATRAAAIALRQPVQLLQAAAGPRAAGGAVVVAVAPEPGPGRPAAAVAVAAAAGQA